MAGAAISCVRQSSLNPKNVFKLSSVAVSVHSPWRLIFGKFKIDYTNISINGIIGVDEKKMIFCIIKGLKHLPKLSLLLNYYYYY